MIGYVTLGVNDLDRAYRFYDALMAELGAKRLMSIPDDPNGLTFYGMAMDRPLIAVTRPYAGGEATPGNGNMVALAADGRDQVDRLHARALELGGSDEGRPGVREPAEMGFYGAYWRDPDGNKFCAFKLG